MSARRHVAVILGGGLTGLCAAQRLEREGFDYRLFEAEDRVGGLCRSEKVDGFTFDYTGHLLHFTDIRVEEFVRGLVPRNLVRHKRKAWIYTNGSYTRYPFQRNLFGLPDELVKECILEYVEAQLDTPRGAGRDFQSWVLRTFGSGIAEHFMIPYNRKLWLTEPDNLTLDWMGRFVPDTSPVDIIKGAFSSDPEEVGYNATFLYPETGGIEILPNSLAAGLSGVMCGSKAVGVDLRDRAVHFADGSSCRYTHLLSTIPLPCLLSCIDPLPGALQRLGERLSSVSVLDVNLGLDIDGLTEKHWIYVPDPAVPYYRLGFPSSFSSSLAPGGTTSVYAEISYRGVKRWEEEQIVRDVIGGMRGMGFSVSRSDVLAVNIIDMTHAYVVYDFDREECLKEIGRFLDANGIRSVGRFGSWSYLSMEESMREGFAAAESLLQV